MMHTRLTALQAVVVLGSFAGLGLPATGQVGPAPSAEASPEAARTTILKGDRWRQMQRSLNEWASVQEIHSAEEIAALREEIEERVAQMSPRELEDFLKDMEDRLEVLLSPEAKEARRWLSEIMTVARDPAAHLGREIPDVMNMTASQIRQELHWVEQRRERSRQSRAAFDRSREMKVEHARQQQLAAQQAQEHARDLRAEAARPRVYRSVYAPRHDPHPRPDPRLQTRAPVYRVGPWGTPIRWDPFNERR